MMKYCATRIVLLHLALSVLGPQMAAAAGPDCERPSRPSIPDGASATDKQLLAARTTLEAYLGSAQNYLSCLREFEESLGEKVDELDGHDLLMSYNEMVDEMYLAGDEFNIALRKFKRRQEDE